MTCQKCIERCQTKGGCWGDDREFLCQCERCGCEQESPDRCHCSTSCFRYRAEEEHQAARHGLVRTGSVHKCPTCGSTVDTNPADQMREAGISPMI